MTSVASYIIMALVILFTVAAGFYLGAKGEKLYWLSRVWKIGENGRCVSGGSIFADGKFYYLIPESGFGDAFVRRSVYESVVAESEKLVDECAERLKLAEENVAKLQAFKDWVHSYLDTKGVPHHPHGPHGAEGCRIGDRMDWLMDQLSLNRAHVVEVGYQLKEAKEEALEEKKAADTMQAEVNKLIKDIDSLKRDLANLRERHGKAESLIESIKSDIIGTGW